MSGMDLQISLLTCIICGYLRELYSTHFIDEATEMWSN